MKNLNYALVKKIGENNVLLECNNKEYEVELTEDIKQPIYDAMEEGIFTVPFDAKNKKILMTVDTKAVYEVFPEHELEELKNATDDIPDEHK